MTFNSSLVSNISRNSKSDAPLVLQFVVQLVSHIFRGTVPGNVLPSVEMTVKGIFKVIVILEHFLDIVFKIRSDIRGWGLLLTLRTL